MDPLLGNQKLVADSLTTLLGINGGIIAGIVLFIVVGATWFMKGLSRFTGVLTLVFFSVTLMWTLFVFNQRTNLTSQATIEATLVNWNQERIGNGITVTFETNVPSYGYLTYRDLGQKNFFPYTEKGDLTKTTKHSITIPEVPPTGGEIFIYINSKQNPPEKPYSIK